MQERGNIGLRYYGHGDRKTRAVTPQRINPRRQLGTTRYLWRRDVACDWPFANRSSSCSSTKASQWPDQSACLTSCRSIAEASGTPATKARVRSPSSADAATAVIKLVALCGLVTVGSAAVNAQAASEPSPPAPGESSLWGANGGLPRLRYLRAVVGFVPFSRAMLSSTALTLPLRLKS